VTIAEASVPQRPGRGLVASALALRNGFLTIDKDPRALAFTQTPAGIVLIHLAFLALAAATGQISAASLVYIALTLAALAAYPAWRWRILGVAGAIFFALRPFRAGEKTDFVHETAFSAALLADLEPLVVQAGLATVFLGCVAVALWAQRRWPKAAPSRRPLLTLLVVQATLIAIGLQMEHGTHRFALVWTFGLFISSSLFFLAYLFADQKNATSIPPQARLGFVRPFWGGPGVPFKGPAFLAKFEARSEDALAATRLKALKLMTWAMLLTGLGWGLDALFYGIAKMPTLNEAINAVAGGSQMSRLLALMVVAKNFILTIIAVSILSHVIVAVVRMAGLAIPRNTARPLSARSVAEFWNRYVFYFKEVLVDFFFYPAFARYFKGNTRLRIAFATFCAAFVGNVLFTVIAQANLFAEIGVLGVMRHFESYAFYALLLTAALIVSQLRNSRPRPEQGWLRYDVMPRVGVISLFAFLLIFTDEGGVIGLSDRLQFTRWLLLFGL